ncbi:MAG: S46 family peptidase, partial [Bacteroidia bacterium]
INRKLRPGFNNYSNKKVFIMIKKSILLFSLCFSFFSFSPLEEGMFPLNELHRVDLEKAGLKIPLNAIYNPNGTSLVQALVRVGGCTGSFVSDEGLIITNHHCAFGAVAAASDPEHDYITEGFMAGEKSKEIPTSIKARITASYEDVSSRVLGGLESISNPSLRSAELQKNIEKLVDEEEAKNPELLIEVSEMLQGKSYTLFRYQELKDIRLVYVPQRSVGEFGGESDNWVWPRHTGDFSFMRAYVGKDGKPADFSPENVPYVPKQYLKINPKGVKENDFVFILGYPGRTFRNQPAQFLEYQNDYQMPYISQWFDFQIEQMQELGKNNKALEIAFASRIKSLANTTKNYKGKMQGLSRTTIIQDRQKDDNSMQLMVEADPELKAVYGTVFQDINRIYAEKLSTAQRDLWLSQVFSSSGMMYATGYTGSRQNAYKLVEKKDKKAYLTDQFSSRKAAIGKNAGIAHPELEKRLLKALLYYGAILPENQRPKSLAQFAGAKNVKEAVDAFVDKNYSTSLFSDTKKFLEMVEKSPEKLMKAKDPFLEIASDLWANLISYQDAEKKRQDELTILLPKMIDIRQMYEKTTFLPDANSTLRFTYGYVRGYSPADAEYHHPFTTVKGILQKAQNQGDYYLEEYIRQLLHSTDPMSVVCFLYNLDTTGGNSGSPILDANGYLIGVNFDRAYTATINDFAWNEEYSRSIGVDIRYVLLIVKELGKGDHLLKEMGI